MEFLAFLKIGFAMSISIIVGVLLSAYAALCFALTLVSIFFWDTGEKFKNQKWLFRILWLTAILPVSIAVFISMLPLVKNFIHYIWSFV